MKTDKEKNIIWNLFGIQNVRLREKGENFD